MNQTPDWNRIPSGQQPEGPAAPKRSAGLLFSGVLIAISLMAFVLPLAAYHVAQVASVLRVRSSIALLLAVSFVLYMLGLFSQSPAFVMAGTTGILSAPLLAIALLLRSRNASVWWALLVLAVPIGLALVGLMQVPQGLKIEDWVAAEISRLPDSQGVNKEQILAQLRSTAGLEPLQRIFNLEDWQRIAWFLFSEGGAVSVMMLASLIATLVLIDFAFAQAERIRAVIAYVLQKTEIFPRQMVGLLEQTHESLSGLAARGKFKTPARALGVEVVAHEKSPVRQGQTAGSAAEAATGFLKKLMRDPSPEGTTELLGYRFVFSQPPGWNFRSFAVPLWLSLPALGVLLYLATLWQGDAELATWLPAAPLGEVLVWSAFVALAILVAVALQGALVIHARLRPLVALFLVFVLLILVSGFKGGALTLVAVLASLGLIDNVYDFRKRLAKSRNAV